MQAKAPGKSLPAEAFDSTAPTALPLLKPCKQAVYRCSVQSKMVREIVEVSLRNFENRKAEIASQLFEAAKDVGFFYISGERGSTQSNRAGRAGSAAQRPHLCPAAPEPARGGLALTRPLPLD
jgi:hypothetical protein